MTPGLAVARRRRPGVVTALVVLLSLELVGAFALLAVGLVFMVPNSSPTARAGNPRGDLGWGIGLIATSAGAVVGAVLGTLLLLVRRR